MRRFLWHDTCGRDYLTPVVADGSTRGNINHPTIAWVKKNALSGCRPSVV